MERAGEGELGPDVRLGPYAARAECAEPGLAHANGDLGGMRGIGRERVPVSREVRSHLLERHERHVVLKQQIRLLTGLGANHAALNRVIKKGTAPVVELGAEACGAWQEARAHAYDGNQYEHAQHDAASEQQA